MRHWRFIVALSVAASLFVAGIAQTFAEDATPAGPVGPQPHLTRDVLPLLKAHCVKCHGPAKAEGGLNLSTPGTLLNGGENGAVVYAGDLDGSLLWHRVETDEMPPEEPLSAADKATLKQWIAGGAKGLPAANSQADGTLDASGGHWSFMPLAAQPLPQVRQIDRVRTSVDRFILAALEAQGLSLSPEAERNVLIRRVSFDLTGLPPTLAEIKAFQGDQAGDAYERMVERYLASPHYGQRWGRLWLDAAGYADSNGYFNADSDRPLAYRYRDYVVRAMNQDLPLDRFIVEQIAGDELIAAEKGAAFTPGQAATPEVISLLEATHYLRNGQDGTGESDGNAEEVRIDRYSALESCMQIVSSSLLGLTMQCAKCHDHKFEPLSQRDYYQFQSVFYPAFNVVEWTKPNERVVEAPLPGENEAWEERRQSVDRRVSELRNEFAKWAREHRPPAENVFRDTFDDGGPALAENWSSTAPGDDTPGGTPAVALDSDAAPGAARRDGTLRILESGAGGDRWLSTRRAFDWTPELEGEWVQVSFDLIDNKAAPDGTPAERIAFMLALVDFDDNGSIPGGNVLIDGNPAGGAAVHGDYPGADGQPRGTIGKSGYEPGHNYAVRITKLADGKFQLEQIVDSVPEEPTVTLTAEDLPDGGFGFEYCCRRSFVVDNVEIERSAPGGNAAEVVQGFAKSLQKKKKALAADVKAEEARRGNKPGRIACVREKSPQAPDVFLLERGNYNAPKDPVTPAPLAVLAEAGVAFDSPLPDGSASTGRRLAWAQWLTRTNSRPAALLARVQANRLWLHHFGRGIVATSENLGVSGAPPSHPELLDFLASELVAQGWSLKAMHRLILNSTTYRQASTLDPAAFKVDPNNQWLWRMPLKRLDAEAVRDAMLATSGRLDDRLGGPYVPTTRNELGEVVVDAKHEGANRRSLYLQHRRTQMLSMLNVFDSPTMVFNCVQRPVSTMPLQSLSLLNSEFMVEQSGHFAARLLAEAQTPETRVERAFLLAVARPPSAAEQAAATEFIVSQQAQYAAAPQAEQQAWTDFCQMLLATNAFLYVE